MIKYPRSTLFACWCTQEAMTDMRHIQLAKMLACMNPDEQIMRLPVVLQLG